MLILWALLIYSHSLDAPFIFDDLSKIADNSEIRALSNFKSSYLNFDPQAKRLANQNDPSRPITYFTFTLNYLWGGLNPIGYHFFNLLLHILSSLLVFVLIRKIIFLKDQRDSFWIPFLVSILFISHPMQSNAVTYVFSRAELLAAFFYLCSLIFFLHYWKIILYSPHPEGMGSALKKSFYYIFSMLFFIAALFSKQNAVTLPVIILILVAIISECDWKKVIMRVRAIIPFFFVFFLYLLFRMVYLGGVGDLEAYDTLPRSIYILNQPFVILKYIEMNLFPKNLSIDHALLPRLSFFTPRIFLSWLTLVLLVTMGIFMIWKKQKKNMLHLFGCLWFIVTLSPTSSFFPTTSLLVENRVYLPNIGFFLALVLLIFSLFKVRLDEALFSRKNIKAALLFVSFIGILSLLSWKRNQKFKNPIELWQEVIAQYPHHYRAFSQLGLHYRREGNGEKAIKSYLKAIEMNPNYMESYYNLGNAYLEKKEYSAAALYYLKSLELDPEFLRAYYNLGIAYFQLKEYKKSLESFERVQKLDSQFPGIKEMIVYLKKSV
ncbi:MAG: tetratricopeptide repeat protein [Elusimicrobia bacterium]|nr:tetratricopeptide repeat protein [Elusimicrobiota bacterium]